VAYLIHRFEVFRSLVTRSEWGLWGPFYDKIMPNDLGIAERPVEDSLYFRGVKALSSRSVVFVPLLYIVIALVAVVPTLVIGLRRRDDSLVMASALYASGLAHMVGLFFFAASADFRYSHWMITATVVASSLVLLDVSRWLHFRTRTTA
jgi:hypothetical protein